MNRLNFVFIALFFVCNCYAQFVQKFDSIGTFTSSSWQPSTGSLGTWAIFDNSIGTQVSWAVIEGTPSRPPNTGGYLAYMGRENVPAGFAQDWFVTPSINLAVIPNPELRFFSRQSYGGDSGTLYKIFVSTTMQTGINNFNLIRSISEPQLSSYNSQYREHIVDLSEYAGQSSVYIAFVMEGDFGDNWMLDDITVTTKCAPPTALAVHDVTGYSGILTWDQPGSANQWEVEIVPISSSPTGSGVLVTQNSYPITATTSNTPLDPDSVYKVYVRSICEYNSIINPSEWSISSFKTARLGETCSAPFMIPSQLPFVSLNQQLIAEEIFTSPGTSCGPGSTIFQNRRSTVYSYTATANSNINITVSPDINKAGVFIYDDCANIGINCIAGISTLLPLNKTISNFAVNQGNTYYIVVSAASNTHYDLIVTEACNNSITAEFDIVSDCLPTSAFTVLATISDLGSATSLEAKTYKIDGTVSAIQTILSPGQIAFGPYLHGEIVKIELKSQQNNNCILFSEYLSKELCAPLNDECSGAINLFDMAVSPANVAEIKGRLTGATASSDVNTCAGTADDDVWYQFIAQNTKHIINIFDVVGTHTNINHSLYQGNCGSLNLLYCSNRNYSLAENLVVGQIYRVRVFSDSHVSGKTDFTISTTSFAANCMDNNPQSEHIKTLYVNLLNYLISNSGSINSNIPFFCTELAALAPFISDADPKIYNYNRSPLSFSFSDHPEPNYDLFMNGSTPHPYIAEINFFNYGGTEEMSYIHVTYTDGSYITKECTTKHINFCPSNPCVPLAGNITINPGMSCVVTGNPTGFSFPTPVTSILGYVWAFYDNNEELVATSYLSAPVMTFDNVGSYKVKLIIVTNSGCSTTVEKGFIVSEACTEYCTETDAQTHIVKQLYINLINYLIENYTQPGQTIPSIINCPELLNLSPYIDVIDPKIYNMTYIDGQLRFWFDDQFSNHVSVPVQGTINDITLLPFSGSSVGMDYETSYTNGSSNDKHYISHIKFCPGTPPDNPIGTPECSPITGTIVINSGVSCIPLNAVRSFSLVTSTSNITELIWTFFDTDGLTILHTASGESALFSYSGSGEYIVQVEVKYGNKCSQIITKIFTVVSSSSDCAGCTEINAQSVIVKQLYLNLVNHLIGFYMSGNSLPANPYTCVQLSALAPYIEINNPKIWNANYDSLTGILKFSFSNTGAIYHVSVPATQHITDINIMNYSNSVTAMNFETYFVNNSVSNDHSIKYVNFCPAECNDIIGSIHLNGGSLSCIPQNEPVPFALYAIVPPNSTFLWTFYKTNGDIYEQKTGSVPTFTYNSVGYHQVKVAVTDVSGCTTTFYKTILVSQSCSEVCTETNPIAAEIKYFYISLINKLLNIYESGQTINPVDVGAEITFLTPYLTNENPGVYNVTYVNQILSFSFSQSQTQPDVIVYNHGNIVDVNILDFVQPTTLLNGVVTYSNGIQSLQHSVKNLNFCPPVEIFDPCESHVAFILDESGSIDDLEASDIRNQLRAFVAQQEGSNMKISFIGMSDSDNNKRNDHVSGKITESNRSIFDNWIRTYKLGYVPARQGVGPNSDYWASGLQYALSLSPKPELLIVITDGSQSSDPSALKALVSGIVNDNSESASHLYIYGVSEQSSYVTTLGSASSPNFPNSSSAVPINVTGNLRKSLQYLLGLPPLEFPISNKDNITLATYFDGYTDFSHLYYDPTYFTNQFANNDIGCGGEPADYCNDCQTFQPNPNTEYWISAWVKEEQNIQVKNYTNAVIKVVYENGSEYLISNQCFTASGDIIDGWQRIAARMTIPQNTEFISIELENNSSNIPVYFDDIRIHPINGSMKSFVYDPETFKLMAEQDDNNYSTFYEYDKEGGLIRIKKETAKGIQTLQESRSGNVVGSP